MTSKPIFFERNRVGRVYTGGALFSDFFGDAPIDNFEPEEWVVSSVKAINKESKGDKEGISCVRGTQMYFDELLQEHKKELLGDREEFGVLTKILDSAIRLPIQAHPDKAFSNTYFHSNYGKTEAWIVLGTRPNAALYFGFKDKMTKERFAELVKQSETDKNVMEPLLNRVEVKTGDVFLVPARMVHAIGQGCLILEIQEPTDFTIQPEYWCGDYHLNEQEMYLGLTDDTALDVFDYTIYGEEAVNKGRCVPRVISNEEGCMVEELVGYQDTPCFAAQRYTITEGETEGLSAPSVCVITDGEGEVVCDKEHMSVKKGDYFFLPYSVKGKTILKTDKKMQAIICLPPKDN